MSEFEVNTKDFMTDLMDFFTMEDDKRQKVVYALLLVRTTRAFKYSGDTVFVCAVMKRNGEWGYYPFDRFPDLMEFAKDYIIFGNAESEFIQPRLWEELANAAHDELEYGGRKRNPAIRKKSLISEIYAVLNLLGDECSLFDILDYTRELVTKEAQVVG